MTEGELILRLQHKFAPPYHIFLAGLRNATGFDASRTADAIAIGLYRSQGTEIHGFEIKVSRGDWLRELKDPAKADAFFPYCDRWSIVVPEPDLIADGELPEAWGLYAAKKKGLKIVVPPKKLAPLPLPRPMLVSIIKYSQDLYRKPAEQIAEAARQSGYDDGYAAGQRSPRPDEESAEKLTKAIADFETASGLTISHWNAGYIGKEVAAFSRAQFSLTRSVKDLAVVDEILEEALASVREVRREMKEAT